MTSILCVLLALLTLAIDVPALTESGAREQFMRANRHYEAGEYAAAVASYDSLVAAGYSGLEVWFNKGNSHYRLGETGPAILCWRRAEAVAPFDRDVQKNLEIASRLLVDDLGDTVRLPVWDWLDLVLEKLPRDLTAMVLLAAVSIGSLLLCLCILGRLAPGPVAGFGLWASGLATLGLVALLALQVRHHETGRQLVIQAERVRVAAAPLADAESLFDLHRGTTVRLVSESPDWWRLRLPDGREGWIPRPSAEAVEGSP